MGNRLQQHPPNSPLFYKHELCMFDDNWANTILSCKASQKEGTWSIRFVTICKEQGASIDLYK